MSNRLSHPRAQRAIASFFLGLVVLGAVAALVRSFHAATAAVHASPPAITEPVARGPEGGSQR